MSTHSRLLQHDFLAAPMPDASGAGVTGRGPTIHPLIAEHIDVVHLIATARAPLHPLLARALGGASRIAFWGRDIARLAVKPRDSIVVDLLDGGPSIPCTSFTPLARRAHVWLVIGCTPVSPDWMEVAAQPGTHMIRCFHDPGRAHLDQLVVTLERQLRKPRVEELVSRLLEAEPRFLCAKQFVAAILAHPWEARHPMQLALLAGRPLADLKATCRALGFRRAEHFMVAIRLVAVDLLSAHRGLSVAAARELAGVADTSNFRRQLRRAARGSRDGIGRLKRDCTES